MTVSISESAVIALAACLVGLVSFSMFDGDGVIISCILGWAMLATAASDAKRFIIPDALSLPAIPLGLLATYLTNEMAVASQAVLEHTIAAAAASALLWLIRRAYYFFRQTQGLGLGDVKLGAVAGAWLGMQGAINALLLTCIMALAYAVGSTLLTGRPLTRTSVLPLGVFLAPAIWIGWCVADLNAPASIDEVGSSVHLIVPAPIG